MQDALSDVSRAMPSERRLNVAEIWISFAAPSRVRPVAIELRWLVSEFRPGGKRAPMSLPHRPATLARYVALRRWPAPRAQWPPNVNIRSRALNRRSRSYRRLGVRR